MFNVDYFMANSEYQKNWASRAHMVSAWTNRDYVDGIMYLGQTFKTKPVTMLPRLPYAVFSRYREPVDRLSLLGPAAIATDGAFRSDGSILYDPARRSQAPLANLDLGRLLPTVPTGTGSHMDHGELEKLREFGKLAKERGAVLVGVQLPYLKVVTDVLDSGRDYDVYHKGQDAAIWREFISDETRAPFEDMGILFYDLSRHPVASDPRGFIDVAHPSEVVTPAALIEMFKTPRMKTILSDIDISSLERTRDDALRSQMFLDVYRDRF
jgi:hypothetical protein